MNITCKVCNSGDLIGKIKSRRSFPLVLVGYLLVASSSFVLVGSVASLAMHDGEASQSEELRIRQELTDLGVPPEIIEQVVAGELVDDYELERLSEEQQRAVEFETDSRLPSTWLSWFGTGDSAIGFAVASFFSAVLGVFLILKKIVLQCTSCGATVSAS